MPIPVRPHRARRSLTLACLAALTAAPAAARTTGIVGYSGQADGLYCSNAGFGCHATAPGTMPPLVSFDGPTQVDPGAEVTYRFTVTSQVPQVQIQAGFNVAASAGELVVVAGQREKLQRNPVTGMQELTHTGPKDNDTNNEAAWEFIWRAPSEPGTYVLFGAGNSVDFSNTPEGDEAAITTLMITVGTVLPTPTPTVTPTAACAGDCSGDDMVAVNELISCVNVALGSAPVGTCAPCDINDDGSVAVNELVAAVGNALNGC